MKPWFVVFFSFLFKYSQTVLEYRSNVYLGSNSRIQILVHTSDVPTSCLDERWGCQGIQRLLNRLHVIGGTSSTLAPSFMSGSGQKRWLPVNDAKKQKVEIMHNIPYLALSRGRFVLLGLGAIDGTKLELLYVRYIYSSPHQST